MTEPGAPPGGEDDGLAYLLVQLGFHVAGKFTERLAPLGLQPRHFGMLSRLAANEGRSQQAIGELMGLNPTRMVFLVDELEERGLVERRRNPDDRRSHALYLTEQGRAKLRDGQRAGAGMVVGGSLTAAQRRQLTALLRRLADEQGIAADGLPGRPPGAP
jgi:DNA-binding MarR family transcriptional regulator